MSDKIIKVKDKRTNFFKNKNSLSNFFSVGNLIYRTLFTLQIIIFKINIYEHKFVTNIKLLIFVQRKLLTKKRWKIAERKEFGPKKCTKYGMPTR